MTVKDFSPNAEPYTEANEQDIRRTRAYLNENWNWFDSKWLGYIGLKRDFSIYSRRINNKVTIVVNVHPKYEKAMIACLSGLVIRTPIIIELFDDTQLESLVGHID
jgi:hypothetical protein